MPSTKTRPFSIEQATMKSAAGPGVSNSISDATTNNPHKVTSGMSPFHASRLANNALLGGRDKRWPAILAGPGAFRQDNGANGADVCTPLLFGAAGTYPGHLLREVIVERLALAILTTKRRLETIPLIAIYDQIRNLSQPRAVCRALMW